MSERDDHVHALAIEGGTTEHIEAEPASGRRTLIPERPAPISAPLTAEQRAIARSATRLVERAAKRIEVRCRRLLSEGELVSVGYLGLIRAARSFDPTRGVRFSTYAIKLVVGAMRMAIRSEAALRERERLVGDTAAQAASSTPPSVPGVTAALTTNLIGARCAADRAREDVVVACDALAMRRDAVREALSDLPESKRELVVLHYVEGMTLREAASVLGKSYATLKRWHDIAKESLAKLLAHLRTTPIPSFGDGLVIEPALVLAIGCTLRFIERCRLIGTVARSKFLVREIFRTAAPSAPA